MFYRLARLSELYEGYQQAFTVAGCSLLLIMHEGRTQLLLNSCPHAQAPLSRASIKNGFIKCSMHGMSFDLQTGVAHSCGQSLQFFSVVYQDQYIGVDL